MVCAEGTVLIGFCCCGSETQRDGGRLPKEAGRALVGRGSGQPFWRATSMPTLELFY